MRRLRIGTPRAALVIAPHADDEAIGAFGLIAALRRRGTRVQVVVVSDGAASHPGSARWSRRRLVAARRAESRRALCRMGLAAGRVRFLDLPDGALGAHQQLCRRAIGRVVAATRGLGLIVGPGDDDHHPDHRAVAAAIRAARHPARRLSYRVWPATRDRLRSEATLPLGGSRLAKWSVIRGYRTQTGAITDDPRGFTMSRRELAAFSHSVERYVEVRR